MKTIRLEKAFDDPFAVRARVKSHAPYCTMASYLPVSVTIGEQASAPQSGALPWFRGTWAANGRPLVDGAELILENPRFREAASRLFDGAEVMGVNDGGASCVVLWYQLARGERPTPA